MEYSKLVNMEVPRLFPRYLSSQFTRSHHSLHSFQFNRLVQSIHLQIDSL